MHTMRTIAGALGLTGVILGALGAHALKSKLASAAMTEVWQTAVHYQLIHAVAILAITLGLSPRTPSSKALNIATVAWAVGVLLFSGSLYILALGGPRWLGPITPLGGVALLIGWVCVLISARTSTAPKN